jgi:hypothetical protein
MQMGVPVAISSKVNTWPYVKDACAGIVLDEERIKPGLKDSILSLLQDGGMRRLMGNRGQEYARTNLTWARATSRLLECYDEVLACGRSAGRNR